MRTRHKHFTPGPPEDPSLFTPPAQPVDTSITAAEDIAPHAETIRRMIEAYIGGCGMRGATAGEVCEALDLDGSTVRPRLRELEGNAPWAEGKLPKLIERTPEKRNGMRVYKTLSVR